MDRTNTLVIVCGAPGVGKTTVAQLTADELTGDVLRSDVIRKELVENPTYSPEETREVYTELLDRAERRLRAGEDVILDATFSDREFRDRARERGRRLAGRCRVLKVTCEEPIVKQRLETRDDVSDADFDIHKQIKDSFDPIVYPHTTIDNSNARSQTHEQVSVALL